MGKGVGDVGCRRLPESGTGAVEKGEDMATTGEEGHVEEPVWCEEQVGVEAGAGVEVAY